LVYIDQWTWLLQKWKTALQTFPIHLTKCGAFGRLVRTTIGVGIARLYGFAENNDREDLDRKFFQALQMGFYYGVAYALVDGLQDSQNEQQQSIDVDKWLVEMERILCGHPLDPASLPQLPATPLLLETFHSLVQLTSDNSIAEETFIDLALLLRSQRSDKKDAATLYHDDVDLYLGSLMKAHFTYTATAFMGGAQMVHHQQRLWTMPFLGQLTDDCRDFYEDRQDHSITSVTYYAQHTDLTRLNPFFVFLFVCEDLYLQSERESNTGAFLGRRIIRTLRSLQKDLNEFLITFTSHSDPDLYKYALSLEKLFDRVSDPEKSIFRTVNKFAIEYSFNHRKLETFAFDHLPSIENHLTQTTHTDDPIILGMNHSLKAGGKRLRPLLLLMVAQIYHIDIRRVLPLATAIEYLHTSSLIFDDLPAQDNAPLRRGQPTLHMPIESDTNSVPPSLTEGRAQLVAVDLIARAIRLVTVGLHREGFSYESINQVTAELSQSMDELCQGQFLDLQAARTKKFFTVQELDRVAELKTGKAIEIVLVCPVILAQQEQSMTATLERLRELGKLMGVLFQMKDDLLDVEGNIDELGKLPNIDQQNQTVTYVSLLGVEETRRRIMDKRKQAEIILKELWPQAGTIRDVIRHICERTK
jgi:geranylgeranyl pyrophosphate synthase